VKDKILKNERALYYYTFTLRFWWIALTHKQKLSGILVSIASAFKRTQLNFVVQFSDVGPAALSWGFFRIPTQFENFLRKGRQVTKI
jgi:hypothetical protein